MAEPWITLCACAFLLALAAASLTTPFVIDLAHLMRGIDPPGVRKLTRRETPRVGGVAIAASIGASAATGLLVSGVRDAVARNVAVLGVFLLGGGTVFALGLYRDLHGLDSPRKFLFQGIAAFVAWHLGLRFETIGLPVLGTVDLGVLGLPLTVLWIVGVVNAINLVDELDGLAAGLALIVGTTVGVLAVFRDDVLSATFCASLAGALCGFLYFNWNPARVFMGDCGSMTIGYVLAVLALRSSSKGPTAVAIVVPILALGVPVIDSLIVMGLRFSDPGKSTLNQRLQRMFRPDRNHLHHVLLETFRGHHRQAVAVLYTLAMLFAAGAFWVARSNNETQGYLLLVSGLLGVILVRLMAGRMRAAAAERERAKADFERLSKLS